MESEDKVCSLAPYFKVSDENLDIFKKLAGDLIEKTKSEADCLYYSFTMSGNEALCREGYTSAGAIMNHLENVAAILGQVLEIAEITRLEVHGPNDQVAILKDHLADLNPQYFELLGGFNRIS